MSHRGDSRRVERGTRRGGGASLAPQLRTCTHDVGRSSSREAPDDTARSPTTKSAPLVLAFSFRATRWSSPPSRRQGAARGARFVDRRRPVWSISKVAGPPVVESIAPWRSSSREGRSGGHERRVRPRKDQRRMSHDMALARMTPGANSRRTTRRHRFARTPTPPRRGRLVMNAVVRRSPPRARLEVPHRGGGISRVVV